MGRGVCAGEKKGHPTVGIFKVRKGRFCRVGAKLPKQWMVGLAGELVQGWKVTVVRRQ